MPESDRVSRKATAAAMRAAEALFGPPSDAFDREWMEGRAAVIDRETGLTEMVRVLEIARDRAVALGDECVRLGGVDMNRGQFLALVEATLAKVSA